MSIVLLSVECRPYMSLHKSTMEDPHSGEPISSEKLTCDLSGLMSSRRVRSAVSF